MKLPKLIGLAGTFAAGKDTLAEYLQNAHGFVHISTSDLIRESSMEKYGNTDRPTLRKHANELRADHGADIVMERSLERAESHDGGAVISGIRSIGEVELLKKNGGIMLFIDADQRIRYERAFARKRDVEANMTFEEFVASEQKELDKPRDNHHEQNLYGVRDHSDHVLQNADTPEALFRTFEELFS